MDEKDEIPLKLLCMSCLCVGRNLRLLSNEKLKRFYLDTIKEIPLNNIPIISPYFCWECETVIKKVVSFRDQIQDSYRIFLTYPRENLHECLLTDVVRPPRLRQRTLSPFSIAPQKVPTGRLEGSDEFREVKIELEDRDDLIHLSDTENSLPSDTDDVLDAEIDTLLSKTKKTQNNSKATNKTRKTHTTRRLRNGLKNLERCPLSDAIPKSQNRSDFTLNSIEELTTDALKGTELVKDELKLEVEWERDSLPSDDIADADLDVEIEKFVSKVKDKKRCKVGSKIKQAKKLVKRLESQLKTTKPTKKVEHPKVRTIELSYEEMLVDRDRELERDSYVNSAYKCETCIIGFNYKNSLKTHNETKHSADRGDYICPICKTIISSVESFTAHHKRHMRRYECTICQKRTMDLKVMQQHYYSSHEISLKQYKCDLCGKISNSIDSHRYHKDSHKARVQCTECDKTFTHRAGLMNHRQSVHELNSAFPCTICNKVFRWKTSLRRHVEKHDVKEKSATAAYCATCGVTFSSVCSYQRHMRNSLRHVTPEQLRFICDHCKRRFADKTKLRDHIEEKHLHRTYQCHICMKPSKNRVGLDQHIRNVHKGRPNNKMCHHCGKGFPTKVQLESHIRTHTGERPFICEFCPTTFSQQSNLYKHNRQVHLNIKTKRYPMCKKRKEDKPVDPPSSPPTDPYRPVAVLRYSPDRGFVM